MDPLCVRMRTVPLAAPTLPVFWPPVKQLFTEAPKLDRS